MRHDFFFFFSLAGRGGRFLGWCGVDVEIMVAWMVVGEGPRFPSGGWGWSRIWRENFV